MRSVARLLILGLAACAGSPSAPTTPPPPVEAPAPSPAAAPPPAPGQPRAVATPALVPAPLPADPAKVTVHRLRNGMTVYLSPDPTVPSVTAYIAVRAGSAQDPQQSTGLAHYLEHMVFKGSTRLGTLDYAKEKPHLDKIAALYADLRKPGNDRAATLKAIDAANLAAAAFEIPNELDQLYARIGITGLNAFTANDATVYIGDVPKNRLAQWAQVEAERYADPVWRLFWPELEAVYEEKNRSMDNPAWRIDETMMRALFPKHGYGWSSGIGEIEHLKSPAYADMEAFFARYYTPGNMAILLSGDVDASVLPMLEQAFGRLDRPAGAANEPGVFPPVSGRQEIVVNVPSNEGMHLAWQLVPATHADRDALEVLDLLLFDGRSGILHRDLLLPQKVTAASSNPTFAREAGWYELSADALTGQTHAQVEALLLAARDKLVQGAFTDKDVATAVLTSDLLQQRQLENNRGRMELMLSSFMTGEDWTHAVGRRDRLRKVTRADVMRVAKQYLGNNFVAIKKLKGASVLPKIEKPSITAVQVDPGRQSAFAKQILALPAAPIEPVAIVEGKDYERGVIPTGPLVAVRNTRNALFAVRHDYEFGRRDDRLVCLALEVWKVSGSGAQSAEQVTRALHELGLTVTSTCGVNQVSIRIDGADANLDAGMALIRTWLANPTFDDATLKARIAASLTERANALTSPAIVRAASMGYARFGDNSEYRIVPTSAQLKAATAPQLRRILTTLLARKHRTAYFGPRARAAAAPVVALGTGKAAATAPRAMKLRKPNAVILADQETAQTHIFVIWPQLGSAAPAARAAGELFAEYAAPMLYQEVREARGLAYTVTGGYDPGARKIDDSNMWSYIGTQSDKSHDALDAVLSTMGKPIDETRMAVARETVAQNHRIERIPPRAIAEAVYQWEDEGETADPRAARVGRALAVDRATFEAWAKSVLKLPRIVSVTGDRKKLNEAKLRNLAPLTVVPVAKLFGY